MSDKLHTADLALLRAAQTGEGVVPVTEDMLAMVGRRVAEERAKLDVIETTVASVPYEDRLAIACWLFRHIVAHATEGGSYRYLIYERLGFGVDAYVPLQLAGALDVSNYFVIEDLPHQKMMPGDLGEQQA